MVFSGYCPFICEGAGAFIIICVIDANFLCRFFEMVNTITEEKGRSAEEGDCESDSLEVMTLVLMLVWQSFSVYDFFKKTKLFKALLRERMEVFMAVGMVVRHGGAQPEFKFSFNVKKHLEFLWLKKRSLGSTESWGFYLPNSNCALSRSASAPSMPGPQCPHTFPFSSEILAVQTHKTQWRFWMIEPCVAPISTLYRESEAMEENGIKGRDNSNHLNCCSFQPEFFVYALWMQHISSTYF